MYGRQRWKYLTRRPILLKEHEISRNIKQGRHPILIKEHDISRNIQQGKHLMLIN